MVREIQIVWGNSKMIYLTALCSVLTFFSVFAFTWANSPQPAILADSSSTAVHAINEALSWMSGILSAVMVFVIVGMIKHMWNDERHLSKKEVKIVMDHVDSPGYHVPKNIDFDDFVSEEDCKATHDTLIEKIDEVKKEFLNEIKETKIVMEAAKQENLSELNHTRQLLYLLLKQAGVSDAEILRSMNK